MSKSPEGIKQLSVTYFLKSWVKFVRFPNLVIVGLTQYLIRWCILLPFLSAIGETPIFSEFHFFIMVFITILITAGGYIINDLYDFPIDHINKPHKVFINNIISERTAYWLYNALNISSVLLTIYLYFAIPLLFIWVFPITFTMLGAMWWYSFKLKKTVLWGNLTVAFFCALVPLSVYLPEIYVIDLKLISKVELTRMMGVTYAYMAFAFLSTLFREIVKDMEDIEGDKRYGCRTLPIVHGVNRSKQVASLVGIVFLVILAYILNWQLEREYYWSSLFSFLAVIVPLLYTLYLLFKSNEKQDFKKLSTFTKLIMFNGVLYLLVFYFEIYR